MGEDWGGGVRVGLGGWIIRQRENASILNAGGWGGGGYGDVGRGGRRGGCRNKEGGK